jgi:hypothetical protein
MADEVLFEKKGRVAYVTINRPERRNALNLAAMRLLAMAWTEFREDPELWVAIVTGAGDRDFCVGADLKDFVPKVTEGIEELATFDKSLLGPDFDARAPLVAVLREGELYKPVIAAVNGICAAGGMEMLQGTDIRIASEAATFAVAEVKRGLFPGGGSTVRLPRQMPYARAMEILLTGPAHGGGAEDGRSRARERPPGGARREGERREGHGHAGRGGPGLRAPAGGEDLRHRGRQGRAAGLPPEAQAELAGEVMRSGGEAGSRRVLATGPHA